MTGTDECKRDIMTLDEICEYLKISRTTLDRLIANEEFPIIDLGERTPRVLFKHLQEWLDKKKEEDFDPNPKQPK